MANKIQIKRSSTSSTPGSLNAGELAFSNVVGGSGVLFIGSTDGGTVVPIGGVRNPGLLTANQALVANSTSYIDQIKVANLVADQIYANGTFGTNGYILTTSGTTGNVHWVDPTTLATAAAGANTQVQFNDSHGFGAVSDFTFDKDTKTLYIANTVDATTFTGTANNANNLNGKTESNLNVNNASTADSANNASYLSGNTIADIVNSAVANTQSNNNTFSGNNDFTGANNTFDGTDVTFNSNVSVNGFITSNLIPVNNTYSLGNTTNRWDKIWLNGSTIELGNSAISDTANGITISNLQVTANAIIANIVGSTTGISSNLAITAANIEATSAFLRVADVEVSGNLVINGTLTTVNTNNLVVRDNIIKLATGNLTDSLDSGFFVNYSTTQFAGLARDHTDGVFKLFDTVTEPSTTVDFANAATLKAYLKSGGFVSNATSVYITANSSVNVSITANTLTLTTALAANSGGTGKSSYTAGDLLYASASDTLGVVAVPGSAANGQILQIVNNLPAYGTLDGGTF